jgi:membrane dipeptidase
MIIDAHLDLAMNAMEWNRDLRLPVNEIRKGEAGLTDMPDRGNGTVSLPALRRAGIGLVVATQISRVQLPGTVLPANKSAAQAWARTQGQLHWYREMERTGEMRQICNLADLDNHLLQWTSDDPIGFILSLEGADSLVTPDYLDLAFEYGLRAVGPAHYGPGRYANGTDSSGGLNDYGKTLLKKMDAYNMILDTAHLCDDAFWQALELYHGPLWSSHSNCRSLVNHNRQISDEMISALAARNAVIGVALDAWMMVPNWKRGLSTARAMHCGLEVLIDHIDHICQVTGSSDYVGIGSDLDGAFGKEQSPYDLDTAADLIGLAPLLSSRGYSEKDVEKILSGNWLNLMRKAFAKF